MVVSNYLSKLTMLIRKQKWYHNTSWTLCNNYINISKYKWFVSKVIVVANYEVVKKYM